MMPIRRPRLALSCLTALALTSTIPGEDDDAAARRRLDDNLDPLLSLLMASYLPGGHAQADGLVFLPADSDAASTGGARGIGRAAIQSGTASPR